MSTILDIDIEDIIFTDEEHRPPCEYGGCPCEAAYVAHFRIMWKCTHPRLYYCLAHKDRLLALVPQANGFFHHEEKCPGSMVRLDHIEPIQ